MSEKPSFKSELEALERIVRQLEQEDLDLDRALGLFEDGVRRLKTARGLLADAELEVKRVVAEADGSVGDAPLDG
ncbi:MAG TPA: exodeoxyribonuclease VII small subunit [Gemmatimonadales bacterium]|nr:exodeoxyribonuclease VII small subunit [Gemmatimonadales bacterium]